MNRKTRRRPKQETPRLSRQMRQAFAVFIALVMIFDLAFPSASYSEADPTSASGAQDQSSVAAAQDATSSHEQSTAEEDASTADASSTIAQNEADASTSTQEQSASNNSTAQDSSAQSEDAASSSAQEASAASTSSTSSTSEEITADEKSDTKTPAGSLTKSITSADGKHYTVTLEYGANAKISEGATLSFVEYNKELTEEERAQEANKNRPYASEKFLSAAALEQRSFDVTDALGVSDEDYVFFNKQLKLTLEANGKEIQPAAAVKLTVETDAVPEESSDALVAAVLDAKATKTWQDGAKERAKQREALSPEEQAALPRDPSQIFTTLMATNETKAGEGTKVTFSTTQLGELALVGVVHELVDWESDGMALSVYGALSATANVNECAAPQTAQDYETLRAFRVDVEDAPAYGASIWLKAQPIEGAAHAATSAHVLAGSALGDELFGATGTASPVAFTSGDAFVLTRKLASDDTSTKDAASPIEADKTNESATGAAGQASAVDDKASAADQADALSTTDTGEQKTNSSTASSTTERTITQSSEKSTTATLYNNVSTADGVAYSVTLTYGADAGIPVGSTLEVRELAGSEYRDAQAKTQDALDVSASQITSLRAFDITILDANGNEFEPLAPVSVSIELEGAAPVGDSSVVHLGELGTEVLDTQASAGENTHAVDFTTESFSVYTVAYTVDFHWGDYTYSIAGESDVLLSELLAKLGITEITLDDVTDVTFSDPTLVKVEAEGDDWRLTSLEAFDTEESLTLTLANGQQVSIAVTDAQNVCQIVDEDGDVLYTKSGNTYSKARYTTLEDAFKSFQEDTFYYKKLLIYNSADPCSIEMLDAYDIESENTIEVSNANRPITLTTNSYVDTCTISRGISTGSMFSVTGGTLTLTNITIDGGATFSDGACTDGAVSVNGGIINATSGTVNINSGTTLCNSASKGNYGGGAVYANGATVTVTGSSDDLVKFEQCCVTNATRGGGALYALTSSTSVTYAEFTDCYAARGGAVICGYDDTHPDSLTFANCTFTNCDGTSGSGGAILCYANDLALEDCTFTSCTSHINGGVICHGCTTNVGSKTTLTNTTMTGCAANGKGGGVYTQAKTVAVAGGSISSCSAVYGSAIYLTGTDDDTTLTLDGSSITGNTVSNSASGAVQVANGVKIYLEDDVTVTDNTYSSDSTSRNLYLGEDSNTVINTTSTGLGSGAAVGVYVGSAAYTKHGTSGLSFGTVGSTNNLDAFVSDNNSSLIGKTGSDTSLVYWGEDTVPFIIKKVWDSSVTTRPTEVTFAVYGVTGDGGEVDLEQEVTLTSSDVDSSDSSVWQKVVQVAAKKDGTPFVSHKAVEKDAASNGLTASYEYDRAYVAGQGDSWVEVPEEGLKTAYFVMKMNQGKETSDWYIDVYDMELIYSYDGAYYRSTVNFSESDLNKKTSYIQIQVPSGASADGLTLIGLNSNKLSWKQLADGVSYYAINMHQSTSITGVTVLQPGTGTFTMSFSDSPGTNVITATSSQTDVFGYPRTTATNTQPICKITDDAGNTLRVARDGAVVTSGNPAVYASLGDAFSDFGSATFKTSDGTTKEPTHVKMLIENYSIAQTDTLTVPAGMSLTLTTAGESDAEYPYVGTEDTYSTIKRGDSTTSLFTVNSSNTTFATTNITLDGGATFTYDNGVISDVTDGQINSAGGIISATNGAVSIGAGTTMQNSAVTGRGGAIYATSSATLNVIGEANATVAFNKCYVEATNQDYYGGGAIYAETTGLPITYTAFENCVSQKTGNFGGSQGGAIFHNADSASSSTTLTNCNFNNCFSSWAGGAMESDAASITITGCNFTNCQTVSNGTDGGAILTWQRNSGSSSGSTLEVTGCAFTNCATQASNKSGGAIFSTAYTTTVSDTQFTDCVATSSGGGLALANTNGSASSTINGCTFDTCSAVNGGGLHSVTALTMQDYTDGVETIHTSFLACTATSNGGGVYYNGSSKALALTNCVFGDSDDTSQGCSTTKASGGGLYVAAAGSVTLTGCGLYSCNATASGGGVFIAAATNGVTMSGCTLSSCSATAIGGGMYCTGVSAGGTVSISDSTFTSCTASSSSTSCGGGGLYFLGTAVMSIELASTTVSGCKGVNGGGICINGGNKGVTLGLSGTTAISGCTGKYGGGLYAIYGAYCTMQDSATISGCTGSEEAGGVFLDNRSGSVLSTLSMEDSSSVTGCKSKKGGGVYVRGDGSTTTNFVLTGSASITSNSASSSAGGVYLDNSSHGKGIMTISESPSVTSNSAPTGAGIYVSQYACLYVQGSPNFGGDSISSSTGNFSTKTLSNKTNGGESYTYGRQDIYLVGYANKDAESLKVAGDISSGAGSIWVWATDSPHYTAEEQFAFIDTSASLSDSATTLKAFRNAQDDATSSNETSSYLYGVEGDETNAVVWSVASEGTARVILRKVDSEDYTSLEGAGFTLYMSDQKTAVASDLTSDESGIFYVGELAYGTYYLYETTAPTGYSGEGSWFQITVSDEGVTNPVSATTT